MEEKNDKKRGKEIQQWEIPEDLITQQILPWLPIKSLTRFKVISKHWYSTISSPNFILKHTKQPLFSHSGPPVETLLIQSGNNFYLYSCDFDDNVAKKPTHNEDNSLIKLDENGDMFNFGNDTVNLVGCSNGLVCLGEKFHGKYFILWNPSTNQSQKYYPEYVQVFEVMSHCEPYLRWGFGYTSSLDDYYVVRIILEGNLDMLFTRCVVDVYSLRTNTSKMMKLSPRNCCVDQPRFLNNTFYWIAYGMDIVAYDLVRETVDTYPDLTLSGPLDFSCVMGGCLSLHALDFQNDGVLSIVESSGRVASVPCGLLREDFSDLIGFTKTGKIFVARRDPAVLGLFDLGQSSEQSLVEFESSERIYITPYVSSQISPLSPGEQVA